ncbi:MAG: flagellin [Sphingomonas bacterium]
MSRVATLPLQRVMSGAMQRAQEKLATTQTQLDTGKKAATFADLGTETVRNLSTHTMLAQQQAQSTVAKRVGTTLSLYQSNLETIESSAGDLKNELLTAIGTNSSTGLNAAIETAFDLYRHALNASDGGTPLFGGGQTEQAPFAVERLSDAVATSADDAFRDDGTRVSARIANGVDMTYGIGATDIGKGIYTAFQTLAQLGPMGDKPTDAQLALLQQAVGQLDSGLDPVQTMNAENGRRQAQLDTLTERGDQRALLLQGVIEQHEDADLGQVAIDLANQMTVLQASYATVAKLTGFSLISFLR